MTAVNDARGDDEIDIESLQRILTVLLDDVRTRHPSVLKLAHDFYWDIPARHRYDSYETPNQFSMGQLTDDLKSLQAIDHGTSDPIPYALVWLGNVLRAFGEQLY